MNGAALRRTCCMVSKATHGGKIDRFNGGDWRQCETHCCRARILPDPCCEVARLAGCCCWVSASAEWVTKAFPDLASANGTASFSIGYNDFLIHRIRGDTIGNFS
jgi:hypothetical protein